METGSTEDKPGGREVRQELRAGSAQRLGILGRATLHSWVAVAVTLSLFSFAVIQQQRHSLPRMALIGLLCLMVGLAAAFFYARRLVRPIHEVAETAQRIAGGDFTARVEVTSGDEMESLANSFNHMAGRLRQIQQELKAANDYAHDVLESMSDLLIVRSQDGRIVAVNRNACRLLEYDEEELLGRPFETVCPALGVSSSAGTARGSSHQPGCIETCLRTRNGALIPVLLSRSEVKASDGAAPATAFVGPDLRERKRAELMQRERDREVGRHKAGLRKVTSHRALHSGDLNAAGALVTEAAVETLALAAAGLWLYTEDRSRAICLDWYSPSKQLHEKGSVIRMADFPFYFASLETERSIAACDVRNDPRTRTLAEASLVPRTVTSVLDAPVWAGGQVVGVLCLAHAGACRQWTPEEQNYAGSMADLVSLALEACKRKKVQDELKAAREGAVASNMAKSKLLSYMNREIRSSLNAITEPLKRLSETPLDDRQSGYLSTASGCTADLSRAIDDVLEWAEIQSGKIRLEESDFEVKGLAVPEIQAKEVGAVYGGANTAQAAVPADSESADPPIDYESLLAEWDGNTELVASMFEMFLRETTRDVTELKEACDGGDAGRIARLAHRIKGSAGELGARTLASRAASLETMGRACDLSRASACMDALQAEFDRLCSQIMAVAHY